MFWSCARRCVPIVTLVVTTTLAYAEINLELNQATIGTIPVAIEPSGTHRSDEQVHEIARIVEKDLGYSEKIKVVSNATSADFLVRIKRDNLSTVRHGAEQTFCMHLEYPLRKKDHATPKPFCLSGNPKTQLRLIAHQFADRAHDHTTGKRNVFTHKIGYVKESGGQDRNKTYQIAVSDFDRHNEQVLLESTSPIMSLAFSPDGQKLAYVSFEEDVSRIFIQDLTSGNRQVISEFSGVNAAPSWSPDGKKIAMALSFSGITKIYTMDLSTRSIEKITSGQFIDTEPFWLKDGSKLIFSSNRSGSPQIHEYDFKTKKIKQLTFHGHYNVAPQMTSDEQHLIYLSKIDKKLQIVSQNLKNRSIRYLGNGKYDDTPRISPTNDMILYTTANGTQTMLAIVSVDGTIKVPMAADKISLKHPSWSPISQWKH